MICHDKIAKDPRIMKSLAELFQKIQETLDPFRAQTDLSPFAPTQDSPSSETQGKQYSDSKLVPCTKLEIRTSKSETNPKS